MTGIAAWLGRLVRIPSVNPLQAGPSSGVPGEAALAAELAECFRSLGADRVELEPLVDDRPNMYAVIRGHTDRVVALDVHTDTVTVENMTDPPFDGRVEGGAVWGRGALDTKASLAVALALVEGWQRDGLRPQPTLVVVGSIGEEAGGMPGAAALPAATSGTPAGSVPGRSGRGWTSTSWSSPSRRSCARWSATRVGWR